MYICNQKEVGTPSDKLDGLGSLKRTQYFLYV